MIRVFRFTNVAFLMSLAAVKVLGADLISEAILSFPAQTDYVEYDNLNSLRTLPQYGTLRERFSGKILEEAKTTLAQLGIEETQVQEVVTGANSNRFFGLATGTFSGRAAARTSTAKRLASPLLRTEAFCSRRGTCVVFLEDSLVAFGSLTSLKEVLEAEEGISARFSSNADGASLLTNTERRSPVRGVLLGNQTKNAIADFFPGWNSWKKYLPQFSNDVQSVGYSVDLDSKAHVKATLRCSSVSSAAMLARLLGAFSSLNAVAQPLMNSSGTAPFQLQQVSSVSATIYLQVDCAI
jgi:hypothetical protein